ncbi:hypothetical protein BD410DRAFT_838173 [Rickenella mellea]|uniref:Uncharacterized protein n=1 Tax=Rickenella mellea TaxID=50990 RepID=A0A4Y7QB54_9AGAM|nr:hypothetical protein BD410DRAFT_838173 [Rickenella mellea]
MHEDAYASSFPPALFHAALAALNDCVATASRSQHNSMTTSTTSNSSSVGVQTSPFDVHGEARSPPLPPPPSFSCTGTQPRLFDVRGEPSPPLPLPPPPPPSFSCTGTQPRLFDVRGEPCPPTLPPPPSSSGTGTQTRRAWRFASTTTSSSPPQGHVNVPVRRAWRTATTSTSTTAISSSISTLGHAKRLFDMRGDSQPPPPPILHALGAQRACSTHANIPVRRAYGEALPPPPPSLHTGAQTRLFDLHGDLQSPPPPPPPPTPPHTRALKCTHSAVATSTSSFHHARARKRIHSTCFVKSHSK